VVNEKPKNQQVLKFLPLLPIFFYIFSLFFHPINSINQDLGRHLTLGKIIFQQRQIPKTNLFSYPQQNFPFINHHWLPELIFYFFSNTFTIQSLIYFKTLSMLVALGLLVYSVYRKHPNTLTLWLSFLSLLIIARRTEVRPEIFSYLFTAIYLQLLIFKNNSKLIWILPLLQVFWVNSHIYFFIGPALLFFFLINQQISGKQHKKLKKYLLLFLITTACCLINPNTVKGALYPLYVLQNYGYNIVENQSLFFMINYTNSVYMPFFILSVFVWLVSAVLNCKKISFFKIIVPLFFIALTLRAIRSAPFWGIAFLPFTVVNLSQSLSLDKKTAFNLNLAGMSLLIPVLIFSILLKIPDLGIGVNVKYKQGLDFLVKNNLSGPIFNNFDIGGYLIYRLHPHQQVFVDNRPEAFPEDFFQNTYIPMQKNPIKWQETNQQYNFQLVVFSKTDITPWAQNFLNWFPDNKKAWEKAYEDSFIVIWKKDKQKL
jgi:hypothetical protein